MKISKRVMENAKYLNYQLTLIPKPLPLPRLYPEDPQQKAFSAGYYFQVLQKSGFQGWGAGTSGLSDKELKKLNKIFNFKYMGAAEYEGGDLGDSYRFMKKHKKELVDGVVAIEGKKFHYVCLGYHQHLVEPTLKAHALNAPHFARMSKEPIDLHRVIAGQDKNFVGAWDTRSHFVFFTNRNKFKKFKELLNETK